jgi:succinate dehydrogenase hydrophobic anchor subunit
LSFIFRTLRRFFVQILSCIFAVILVLWCIGYALQMQFMDINTHVPTQSRHTEKGERV